MNDQTIASERPEADGTRKTRHDAFDGKRKRAFLDALGKGGCLRDAARRAGVSHQTVYNHQRADKAFARQCALALEMAATDIELEAWERAVKGEEVPIVYRGEVVGTRLRRSDRMLQFLLRAAKPKKYGVNAGFTRKRLTKLERNTIEREVRADWAAKNRATAEETDRAILKKLAAMDRHKTPQRLAQGWTKLDDGQWVPPGWVRADTAVGAALRWSDDGAEQKGVSV
ncbi:hypothetical protein [Sphingomonas lenta]|uniref:Terminase n=1 Tax=Sphingomonas lenta TaxID=1141887 RepID=A0A2A2SD88_9SPHN|nr:hypothetical protein [Sphingomonas lenta]PAX07254.1 hypothetical protein CKY28_14605 [Sphingomonas lenta]